MTGRELNILTKRHFTEKEKMHDYCIFKDDAQFVVARGKDGCPSQEPCIIITNGCCKMYVKSPLSESEFSTLAIKKSKDLPFWVKTVQKND